MAAENQETKRCPQCGTELPPEDLEGLCPRCLAQTALNRDGTPDRPTQGPPGQLSNGMAQASGFSRYQFIQQLGAGGMGEVYLVEDNQLGRKVALKLLSAELAEDDNYRIRFMREAKAASALNHPNICTIYDTGKSEHRHLYIAMEYVQGETLASRLQQRPLDIVSVVDIGIQVADALAAAHAKGMVHRDIKPANISLGDHGLVKLLDFGLAKRVAPQS